jgi:exopolysaccharide biosynthesis polyprenyl glycosylphosphotransferase
MLRSNPFVGPTLAVTGDLLAMLVAWLVAAALVPPGFTPVALLPLAIVHQIVLSGHGLHSQLRYVPWTDLLRRVFWAWLRISLTVVLIDFLWPERMPRAGVLVFCAAFLVALVGERFLTMGLRRFLRQRGRNLRYIVVAGTGAAAASAARAFTGDAGYGLRLAGFLAPTEPRAGQSVGRDRVLPGRVLGSYRDIEALVREHVIDELVIADPDASLATIAGLVESCRTLGLRTHVVADFLPGSWRGVDAMDLHGDIVVSLTPFPHDVFGLTIKRAMDILIAGAALVALAPLFLLIALLVKLDSPGPVFFTQWRIGLNGRRFRFSKFRSMRADAEAHLPRLLKDNEMDGPVFKMRDDPRITRVGRVLRRFSIDELPQLWRVLVGDMSLVGPRPLMPHEIAGHDSWQRRRLSMRPGLTCLWQVSGRNHIDFDSWMRLDLEYIDQWSLGLDLRILARTVPAVLSGRGAS